VARMSKRLIRFVFCSMLLALACSACAPRTKPGLAPIPKTRAVEDQLFQEAEKKYQASALPEALAHYTDYLARYRDEPLAPAALMRIGSIHAQQGNLAQARKAYARLISDYPESPQRSEAELEMLGLLAREGRYPEVVAESAEALKGVRAPSQQARALVLAGDAHAALGAYLKAVEAYTRGLRLAAPSEQELIVPKLRAAILRLKVADASALAERPEDDISMDYLLFQSGMVMAREGRTAEALILLRAFQQRYPRHEHAERAQKAIAEIDHAPGLERRVLGCLLPLTGAYQAIGQRALRGNELAGSLHTSENAPLRCRCSSRTPHRRPTPRWRRSGSWSAKELRP